MIELTRYEYFIMIIQLEITYITNNFYFSKDESKNEVLDNILKNSIVVHVLMDAANRAKIKHKNKMDNHRKGRF